jgi:hypothetical protein
MIEAIPPSLSNGFAIICLLLQKPYEKKKENKNEHLPLNSRKHNKKTGPSNFLIFCKIHIRCEENIVLIP